MNIVHQVLRLFADVCLPVADGLIPIGEICAVAGTPMDFSQPRPVDGEGSIDYDHCRDMDEAVVADVYIFQAASLATADLSEGA